MSHKNVCYINQLDIILRPKEKNLVLFAHYQQSLIIATFKNKIFFEVSDTLFNYFAVLAYSNTRD